MRETTIGPVSLLIMDQVGQLQTKLIKRKVETR